ncbi:hypothetical protein T310_7671 [Rasamsonia emersonii CBS 393.64]|uniref:Uncharacterized protein n=1 Tax=Rasamsonia emersonii (strain ATCC 16479 / CBS 393.64 / IMI 116815) TaxID=1408163 RepID=A0A0F4YKI5_RASE3|nr:hypothetical protein T310_7671 [Rasamsonia emersonii CBS 393.64]KKA18381.1 hypothetical protein T310_7671 [Rasamsonia emersonii CBS 393.64]
MKKVLKKPSLGEEDQTMLTESERESKQTDLLPKLELLEKTFESLSDGKNDMTIRRDLNSLLKFSDRFTELLCISVFLILVKHNCLIFANM